MKNSSNARIGSAKSILIQTAQVSGSTLISKFLALIRTGLDARYLGPGAASDAFWTAYGMPNSMRKVFAEGALTAAFIPAIIKLQEEDKDSANRLMTLLLIVIESLVLLVCLGIFFNAKATLLFLSPGFINKPEEMSIAVPLIKQLIFFIFFVSSSALLAGAMQAVNHFIIPAWGPVLLNIFYIAGLLFGLYFNLSVYTFSWFLMFGGLFLFILHAVFYFKLGFKLALPDRQTFKYLYHVAMRFIPCFFTMSALEISYIIDRMFISYLPSGSITLFKNAADFLRIPLGIFADAFSKIMLSHLSRVSAYAPRRLQFYVFESMKLVFWVTLPATIFMSFFANSFFHTMIVSAKFTVLDAVVTSKLLIILLLGLFFLSLNKILLSVFYSLHSTFIPTLVAFSGAVFNTFLNIMLIPYMGLNGVAIATISGGILQTGLYLFILNKKFKFNLYGLKFFNFVARYTMQIAIFSFIFYLLYKLIVINITNTFSSHVFFVSGLGLWLWVLPLLAIFASAIYLTRSLFGIKIYFLK